MYNILNLTMNEKECVFTKKGFIGFITFRNKNKYDGQY